VNIFILNEDPVIAARDLCDKHVVKMIVESAQLLCITIGDKSPYKLTHVNHPCAKWVCASLNNYWWLLEHAKEMSAEYTRRYHKRHKSEDVIDFVMRSYKSFPKTELTPFVQAVPDHYKNESAVLAYRNYYIGEKSRFAKWNYSDKPSWWPSR
jgi:Pyrimidine dimer DNA glycosylase